MTMGLYLILVLVISPHTNRSLSLCRDFRHSWLLKAWVSLKWKDESIRITKKHPFILSALLCVLHSLLNLPTLAWIPSDQASACISAVIQHVVENQSQFVQLWLGFTMGTVSLLALCSQCLCSILCATKPQLKFSHLCLQHVQGVSQAQFAGSGLLQIL